MNYTRKIRKTYAVLACKIAISVLVASVISYGFLVVGVVKVAASKQHFSEKQAEVSAEINMLEQDFIAIKSGVSIEDPSTYTLSDLSENRSIIDVHSLGIALGNR
ncbi:MAG TPA: hypothetical protein PLF31_00545 [Candidatus Paceibacterota bacterium]|nr:hypothetical protein [Candidatus Paceibacterota bacterium]